MLMLMFDCRHTDTYAKYVKSYPMGFEQTSCPTMTMSMIMSNKWRTNDEINN